MTKTLNITCPVNKLSYGYVSQFLIKHLIKDGFTVGLNTIGPVENDVGGGFEEYVGQCKNEFIEGAPHLIVWHHHGLKQFVIPGVVNIGFPIFELDTFSPQEIEQLNSVDRLFVTCEFYKKIASKYFRKPIDVVNLGVDQDIFGEAQAPEVKQDSIIRFLHAGKWELRKGVDLVIKCFGEEFRDDRDVSLTLLCDNPFLGEDNLKWSEYAKKHIWDDQLNIFPGRLESIKDVARIMHQHQIGLFPAKAEGWNLELHEMLSMNKVCVATDYSAHTEFINHPAIESNIFPVPITKTETAFDGEFFFGQGKWGAVDHKILKGQMRKAFNKCKKLYEKPDIREFNRRFSWVNSVEQIKEALNVTV